MHDLELIVEVAVVAVGADRDAGNDGGAELRRVGVEDMQALALDDDVVGVGFAVGVAAAIRALADKPNLLVDVGETLSNRATQAASADDDYIG